MPKAVLEIILFVLVTLNLFFIYGIVKTSLKLLLLQKEQRINKSVDRIVNEVIEKIKNKEL